MRINADFSLPARVAYDKAAFVPSPMAGVERLMLDRIGDEVARATSIVRYAPESRFSEHTHTGGEEFIVLDGTFSDHFGDFGPGSYVRNPIGTAHAPWSDAGCLIFVKLQQFDEADTRQFQVKTAEAGWTAERPGVARLPLHDFAGEIVRLYRLEADAEFEIEAEGGAEVLVLAGSAMIAGAPATTWDWARFPDGARVPVRSNMGCEIFVKTGHLAEVT